MRAHADLRASETRPRRILVIKLSEMGSTVLALPALRELRRRSPEADLYVLTFRGNAAVFAAVNVVPDNQMIVVDTDSLGALCRTGLAAFRRLRRARLDTVIDMAFFCRFSIAFALLVCRGTRVGFHAFTNEGMRHVDALPDGAGTATGRPDDRPRAE